MSSVFVLLTLLFLVCSVAGLIWPPLFRPLFRRTFGRAKTTGIFLGAMFFAFIAFGLTHDLEEANRLSMPPAPQTEGKADMRQPSSIATSLPSQVSTPSPIATTIPSQIPKASPIAAPGLEKKITSPPAPSQALALHSSQRPPSVTSVPENPSTREPHLGITPMQFAEGFNRTAVGVQSSLRMRAPEIAPGVRPMFKQMFTTNLGIIGSCTSDGNLVSIILMGKGDGTVESSKDILVGMAVVIGAISPELPKEERGRILKETGLFDSATLPEFKGVSYRNGRKYQISKDQILGLSMIVSAEEPAGKF
jgi:hypothetical protein